MIIKWVLGNCHQLRDHSFHCGFVQIQDRGYACQSYCFSLKVYSLSELCLTDRTKTSHIIIIIIIISDASDASDASCVLRRRRRSEETETGGVGLQCGSRSGPVSARERRQGDLAGGSSESQPSPDPVQAATVSKYQTSIVFCFFGVKVLLIK